MKHGDDRWEAAALAACHRLERAPLPGSGAEEERAAQALEWETRHRAFHAALVAAAPAPRLLRLVEQMVEQTERYRAVRLLQSPSVMLARDVTAEHRNSWMQRLCEIPVRPICCAIILLVPGILLPIFLIERCPVLRGSHMMMCQVNFRWQRPQASVRDVDDEHERTMKAVIVRDTAVCALMDDHLTQTEGAVVPLMDEISSAKTENPQ